jgi:hypothetical protein
MTYPGALTGLSGQTYLFNVHPPTMASWNPIAGVYAFIALAPTGQRRVLYIGEAHDLNSSLPSHPKWQQAVAMGANRILARAVRGHTVRYNEEADLIAAYNPPLNAAHRELPDTLLAEFSPPRLVASR